jgi:hypothetical protein
MQVALYSLYILFVFLLLLLDPERKLFFPIKQSQLALRIWWFFPIATGNLTSMQHFKGSLHNQTSTAPTSKEVPSNPMPKQSASHHHHSFLQSQVSRQHYRQ